MNESSIERDMTAAKRARRRALDAAEAVSGGADSPDFNPSEYRSALVTYVQVIEAQSDYRTTWPQASVLNRLMEALLPVLLTRRSDYRALDVNHARQVLENVVIKRSQWLSAMEDVRAVERDLAVANARLAGEIGR